MPGATRSMVVVADTTPLHYLILIDQIEVLPELYGWVIVPRVVLDEMAAGAAPSKVRRWAADPPAWLEVRDGPVQAFSSYELDEGEAQAISLALQIEADLVLIDDRAGRKAAQQAGLRVAGTLAVLDEAASRGMADFDRALAELLQTNFRVSRAVLAAVQRGRALP